jgi:predicted Zn-ribbon and HTH transcriptional regulator
MTARERLRDLMDDASTSRALREYFERALRRDPVDVANELEVAAKLARGWADEVARRE